MPDYSHLFGWVDDQREVEKTLARLQHPLLIGDIYNPIKDSGKGKTVLLYKYLEKLIGKFNVRLQTIGDCQNPSALVRMADGNIKMIADINIGDEVITPYGNKKRVIDKIEKPYNGKMVKIHVAGYSECIESTPDHLYMYLPNIGRGKHGDKDLIEWKSIQNLKIGDYVLLPKLPNEDNNLIIDLYDINKNSIIETSDSYNLRTKYGKAAKITKIEYVEPETDKVYCIGVEDDHSFICNGYGIHNCVSMGAACAVDVLRCVQHFEKGTMESWIAEACTEYIYAISRVDIGGGSLGGGDGSNGSWAAEGCQKYGVILRQKYGDIDVTVYSGEKARNWGYKGAPSELKPIGKEHPVKTVSLVTTYEQARDALANGYPVTIASGAGFSSNRDNEGFARPSGSWAHQMCLIAVDDNDKRPGVLIQNSWGPSWISGPKKHEQPDGSFWCDAEVLERNILSARDSFAFSNFEGFPPQKLSLELF